MKQIIKLFIPPFMLLIYKKLTSRRIIGFSGIFNNVNEINDGKPWIKKEWFDVSEYKLTTSVKEAHNIFMLSDLSYTVLPCLLTNILSKDRVCNVVDFGGGTGFVYFCILPYLLNPENVNWVVVDNSPKLLEMGKEYSLSLKDKNNISFYNEIPKETADILHINATLHYIHDYKATLGSLLKCKPKYVIITRLLAGESDTYITAQNVLNYDTPCVIINFKEFVKFFLDNNYTLVFKSLCPEGNLDYDDNIPKEIRIKNALSVVFKKNFIRIH